MLEYWNNGFWDNAIVELMVKFVSTIKLKMDNILLKPAFQYSNIPIFHIQGKRSKRKNVLYFHQVEKFETLN